MSQIEIGVLVMLSDHPAAEFRKVREMGLASCQVCSWDPSAWTEEAADRLMAAAGEAGVTITVFWSGWTGPVVWNFLEGPKTLGLVPPEHRSNRVEELKKGAWFANRCGLAGIATHVGFLPEDPNDQKYLDTVEALKQVAGRCSELSVEFWFEAGQETPTTLLRTIERIGTGNLGINLDTANVILYGKANPVDALDVFGRYVRGVHAKDGLYPTGGDHLGKEVPLGQGKVNFPAFVAKLKSLGYTGALTIEREISGPQQIKDIRAAVEFLRPLC